MSLGDISGLYIDGMGNGAFRAIFSMGNDLSWRFGKRIALKISMFVDSLARFIEGLRPGVEYNSEGFTDVPDGVVYLGRFYDSAGDLFHIEFKAEDGNPDKVKCRCWTGESDVFAQFPISHTGDELSEHLAHTLGSILRG